MRPNAYDDIIRCYIIAYLIPKPTLWGKEDYYPSNLKPNISNNLSRSQYFISQKFVCLKSIIAFYEKYSIN